MVRQATDAAGQGKQAEDTDDGNHGGAHIFDPAFGINLEKMFAL
jgi:hypothetical protein